ncbi:MAG: SUMF1/EgtB/PvdO family nonheme iron enzyme [Chloroflexi bacterium]|nr:SUMF1/EgtB/PvdO family nonheme iron enzyme [Chloroflexota bacterium]
MPHLLTPRILHDLPLDQPDDVAEFNFHEYTNTFARLIADPATRTPLVIGVSGKWGSGKTTLLRTLQAKLDETQALKENLSKLSFANDDDENKNFRRCRTVWFNAWKYADEDELLVALVRVIVQTMSEDSIVSQVLSKLNDPAYPRRDVVATVLSWFAIKLPGDVEVGLNTGTPKETPFAQKTALLDLFMETFDHLLAVWVSGNLFEKKIDPKRSVVAVFIDDLDRCLPDKAVQVLEAIKLFLDRPGVAFVLAADEDAVQAAIEAHYQTQKITGQRAADYLEKIFQVRFGLPPLSSSQAAGYLATNLGKLDDQLTQNLDLIIAGAEANPRLLKTFVNDLNVNWAILQNAGLAEGTSQADFMRWLALNRVSPAFGLKVRELHKDSRLDFIRDAAKWVDDRSHKTGEFSEWEGYEHRRLRDVLKRIAFSATVTPDVLDRFIFWGAPVVQTLVEKEGAISAGVGLSGEVSVTRAEAEVRRTVELARIAADPSLPDYWIPIPAGKFVMGSRDDNKQARDDERPQHTVEIPYTYRIARYPVTNAEFAEFVQAAGYKSDAVKADLPDHPVVNVSWRDAQAYCKWLTEKLRAEGIMGAKEIARLPTEAEWEKAARGEYGKEWPWGDEWDASKCNSREGGPGTTTPVGKYSPQGDSPYGVADMAGNVWEWCQSKYAPYPYKVDDGREDLAGDERRVLRGGSFFGYVGGARCAFRYGHYPYSRFRNHGFRVAASPFQL